MWGKDQLNKWIAAVFVLVFAFSSVLSGWRTVSDTKANMAGADQRTILEAGDSRVTSQDICASEENLIKTAGGCTYFNLLSTRKTDSVSWFCSFVVITLLMAFFSSAFSIIVRHLFEWCSMRGFRMIVYIHEKDGEKGCIAY